MKLSAKPKRSQRGSIMLLTFFLILFLALLGTGFIALIPVEMRSAHKDRSAVMAGYAAEAGVQTAMNQLRDSMNTLPVGFSQNDIDFTAHDLGNGWEYQIESVTQLSTEEFKVTTLGLLRGVPQRRAVAIIDDGSDEYAIQVTAADTDEFQNINQNGAWPTSIPIKGDVYIQGTWWVNNNGFDMNTPNNNPPFKGTIFQTDPSGGAMRGEKYTSTAPSTTSQYATMYANGMDGIQPYSVSDINPEDLVLATQTKNTLLKGTFGVNTDAEIATPLSAMAVGTNVPNSAGTMSGGYYFKPSGTNQGKNNYAITFSIDANGNGVTVVNNNNGWAVTTITQVSEGGTYNGQTYTADQDKVVVTVTGSGGANNIAGFGTNVYNAPANNPNFDSGQILYIDGHITSIQGTYRGNRTVAAAGAATITGELLKQDTTRGATPDQNSKDALGIVCGFDVNNSDGLSIVMPSSPLPAGNQYYLYCYMTALSPNDTAAKNLSRSQHPNLPSGTKLALIGSLVWAPTTAGQITTAMDYMKNNWTEVQMDKVRPFGFPGKSSWIPRLRCYVDIIVSDG